MKLVVWISDAYNGNVPLWKAFVFGYLIPLLPTTILAGISVELLAKGNTRVPYFLVVFNILFYLWITIVMWRNSHNAKKYIYKILARIFCGYTGIITGGLMLSILKH